MPRHSRRAGTLVLLLAAPVFAQFAELATTDDGSQLYFTSKMLLKGRAPGPWPESRLYRFGPGGVALYAERGALAPKDTGSSSDGAHSPSVSGDGSVVGFTYSGVCRQPECKEVADKIEVRGPQTLDLGPGDVQISRNGRWALVSYEHIESEPGSMSIRSWTEITLVDLSNGQRTSVPLSAVRGAALTSDGGVLAMRPTEQVGIGGVAIPEYGVWRQGSFTPLPIPKDATVAPVAISDDASMAVVYERSKPYPGPITRLAVVSIPSGAIVTMVEVKDPRQLPGVYSIANDGRRVLYSVGGRAYVWDAATGASILVPLEPGELAVGGVLSGNGKFAFVATSLARIARFDLASKTLSDLFPRTPQCDDPGPLAGGSFARFTCNFTAPAADLQGKLTLDGNSVPVLYSNAGEIGVQIPWRRDFFPPSTLSFDLSADSPFQPTQEVRVYDGAPEIVADSSGLFGMKIIKGNWSGLVTTVPTAGDIFHIYMTGLGWTATPETTGVPASTTTPNPIEWTLACSWLPDQQPLELLFAGLAPGMLGIYQTTFRMRPAFPEAHPITGLECYLISPAMAAEFGPGTPVRGVFGRGGVIIGTTPPPPPR